MSALGTESRQACAALVESAPAKVNLTLEIRGRRADGYHELESLVVFARIGDRVRLMPGEPLGLDLRGPFARALNSESDNLVLRAAREFARRVPRASLGRFELTKRLPVASGIGGGSSDAAAALRLLARVSGIGQSDARLFETACAVGADVPVCLSASARLVRGIGEQLSDALPVPSLAAVLVNPGIALATKDVFAALASTTSGGLAERVHERAISPDEIPAERTGMLSFLREHRNELEEPAISLAPPVADALSTLRATPGCELARMSGSGATCFGIFGSAGAALAAARALRASHPRWWICATTLA